MSDPRTAIVRDGIEAFNRGDFMESSRDFSEEMLWDTTRVLPDGGVYRGRAEIHAYWQDVFQRWDEFRIEVDELLTTEDRVVMLGRLIGKGAGSGVPIESPWHQVWKFQGEKPVRCDNYGNRAEALRAAGLGES